MRSRPPHAYLVPLVYLVAGYQFVHYYVSYPFFYLRLPEYFSGRERLPFQLRVLPILILRPLGRNHLVQQLAATRVGPLHNPNRIAFFVLSLVSLGIAWYYLVLLYNAVSHSRQLHFLLYPVFLFILIWTYVLHVEQDMSYPYDLPSLAFFTAGLFYIYRRQFLPLALIVLVGTFNRETTLFLIGIYLLDAASIDDAALTAPWRRRFNIIGIPWGRVALLGALWLAVKLPLAFAFRFNNHTEDILRLHENLVRLLTPWQWPAALNLGGYLLPFVLLFRARLHPIRFRNYLYILLPWAAVIFCTGIILETRVYGELCGYFAVAVVLLLEQYVQSLTDPDRHQLPSLHTSPPTRKPPPPLPNPPPPCTLEAMDKIAALTSILEQHPADAFARYGLAMALAAEGRNQEALSEYTTTLAHSPDYVPAYQMSAQLLLRLGRSDAARDRLQQGLAACDRTGNAHAHSEMQTMLDDLA